MRKYFAQVLIASSIIGIIVRFVSQILQGTFIDTNPFNYSTTIIIGVVIGFVTMITYTKILMNTSIKLLFKYIISYIVIIIVYFIMNILFDGLAILYDKDVYIIALVIIVLSFPVMIVLEQKTRDYNEFLLNKQKENENESN